MISLRSNHNITLKTTEDLLFMNSNVHGEKFSQCQQETCYMESVTSVIFCPSHFNSNSVPS